jgi:hypothetical protein
MMKAAIMILALITLQSVGAQTNGDRPPAVSREFQAAGQLAYEAIERLGDYNDKPDISYEPRHLDAEKAVSEARRKAKTPTDKHISEVLDNWLSGLDGQRQFLPGDGRISNAATVSRAYGEQSKQAIAAGRRALEAQTNADLASAAKIASSCDIYQQGSPESIACTKAAIEKVRTIQDNVAAGKPTVSLKQTPALDYWEQTIFPCAVEASWYFGETPTKEGIEMAKNSSCATASRPKRQ